MGAHTPGPWKAADPGDYGDYNGECIVVLGDHKRVAVVLGYGPESQADARLIAAAPDSYAANVAMVDALNVAFHIEPEWDDERIYDELPTSGVASAYFAARAAIALATGGHR